MNDYERIAQVIRYLETSHTEQPDLATLAAHVGLSRYHFHRLFSAWAGITPKDFLQCLTVSHAKALLRKGQSVLDTALDTGLSGPGRLHDLCVSLEAASPGEIKSKGAGWTIEAGFALSPFGRCLIGESPRGICFFSFVESSDGRGEWDTLQTQWPKANLKRNDTMATGISKRVFNPSVCSNPDSGLRAYVQGTAYQVRVWRALLKLRPGTLVSYGHLAASLDQPRAARSIGSAVAQNRLAYLIPCHRVIRAAGVVGDYRWGRDRKRAMLVWESAAKGDRV